MIFLKGCLLHRYFEGLGSFVTLMSLLLVIFFFFSKILRSSFPFLIIFCLDKFLHLSKENKRSFPPNQFPIASHTSCLHRPRFYNLKSLLCPLFTTHFSNMLLTNSQLLFTPLLHRQCCYSPKSLF